MSDAKFGTHAAEDPFLERVCQICGYMVPLTLYDDHQALCKIANSNSIGQPASGYQGRFLQPVLNEINKNVYDSSKQLVSKASEIHESTSMSSSEEPNFVIYNLIKEMDYIVEMSNYFS